MGQLNHFKKKQKTRNNHTLADVYSTGNILKLSMGYGLRYSLRLQDYGKLGLLYALRFLRYENSKIQIPAGSRPHFTSFSISFCSSSAAAFPGNLIAYVISDEALTGTMICKYQWLSDYQRLSDYRSEYRLIRYQNTRDELQKTKRSTTQLLYSKVETL